MHQMLHLMLIYVRFLPFVTLLREVKEDTVPTVAFAESFDGEGDSGTRSYYLASAHDQVYAQPTGQLGFTGNMQMASIHTAHCSLSKLQPHGASCKHSKSS